QIKLKPKDSYDNKFSKEIIDVLDLLDWQKIWIEMIEFKAQRKYWNLVFDIEALKNILLSERYTIHSPFEIFNITYEEDIKRIEDIALLVIKKYFDSFYEKNAKYFETQNLSYCEVKQLPLPFISEDKQGYIVQIDKTEKELVEKITNLTEDLEKLIVEDTNTETLPRVYFDGSLYVPLLLQSEKINKISPAGLVESEQKFVQGLKQYLKNNKEKFRSKELYLLRNTPFSGVGFQLQWSRFYPDFIMWIKDEEKQTIVFIDPKGLEHAKGLDDEKIVFAKTIKDIEQRLNKENIVLESFILSITPRKKLEKGKDTNPDKEEYTQRNVLFLDDEDWQEKLFSNIFETTTNQ
ncbi:MAG: hypothetical protein QXP36_10235, partial [Conexivisphaerales archaeon]